MFHTATLSRAFRRCYKTDAGRYNAIQNYLYVTIVIFVINNNSLKNKILFYYKKYFFFVGGGDHYLTHLLNIHEEWLGMKYNNDSEISVKTEVVHIITSAYISTLYCIH